MQNTQTSTSTTSEAGTDSAILAQQANQEGSNASNNPGKRTKLDPKAIIAANAETEKKIAKRGRSPLAGESKIKSKTAGSGEAYSEAMRILEDQDELLKNLKSQIQEAASANAALKRQFKQAIKEASRNEELESELNRYKKKFSSLRNIVVG